ncbi:transcriptional regulator [Natrinema sp. CBA1119]|uniref:DUF7344 domain-containing protein n=1 Tax=Natrinema sp. CBA1119 TaxID=1608465 RepID=UPI000BF3E7E5|nr:transcriptional regulator [Natrinema sp. CBA1119]PGF15281.1 transcriptional regulator [Natrinema sp. CBA1119]
MSSDAHLGGDTVPDPLSDVPTECYEILRHPRRLRILEVLGTRGARLSLPELTTELIDRTDPARSNGRARHDVRITLVHNHLPRLADDEIVDWDDDGVALVDESPVHPADLSVLLELCETDRAEGLLETIVDPVRMRLLAALEDDGRPLSLEQLAARLSAHDGGPFRDPDRAAVALHHSHLPALSDVGVVDYDHESKLVTRSDDIISIVQ